MNVVHEMMLKRPDLFCKIIRHNKDYVIAEKLDIESFKKEFAFQNNLIKNYEIMKLEYLNYAELRKSLFDFKEEYDRDYVIGTKTYKNEINSNFKYLNYDFKNGVRWNESPIYLCLFDNEILKGVLKFVYPWKEEIARNAEEEFVCLFYLETN
jgi:hypothetical protein